MEASECEKKARFLCLFLTSAWENRNSGAKRARTFSAECEANGYERETLSKDSVILLEQIRTIDKRRLREHTGHADRSVMEQVDSALAVSFGLQGS